LIVVTADGNVWVIDVNDPTNKVKIASTGVHLEGTATVPDDPAFGHLAGAIIAGAENEGNLWVFKHSGSGYSAEAIALRDVDGGSAFSVEDIDPIDDIYNFFGVDFANNRILVATTPFKLKIGSILITGESPPRLAFLVPTATSVYFDEISYQSGCEVPAQWEHVTLAKAGLKSVPSTQDSTCPYFESSVCTVAFNLTGSYTFKDFDVVSFNNFLTNTGDTQGRIITRKSFELGNGYSVGDGLGSASKPYALIGGDDSSWGSGAIYFENIYVGGNFTAPQYLGDSRTGGPSGDADSTALFGPLFGDAYSCYSAASTSLAAKNQNVNWTLAYEGILIECPVATADLVLDITAADFNKIKWYCPNNCQSNAQWTINIDASEDTVVFGGDQFPAPGGYVTYNVYTSSDDTADIDTCTNSVEIRTDVNGNLLAPHSSVYQVGGVLRGKAIVCNYNATTDASQINRPCQKFNITLQTQVVDDPAGSGVLVVSACNIIAGDEVTIQGETFIVDGADDDTLQIHVNERTQRDFAAGTLITGSYSESEVRKDTKNYVTNSGKRDNSKDKAKSSDASSLFSALSLLLVSFFFFF